MENFAASGWRDGRDGNLIISEGDDARRDAPDDEDLWFERNEETYDSDGWPHVDGAADPWSLSAQIVKISLASSSEESITPSKTKKGQPKFRFVTHRNSLEARDDQEEPGGDNGDVLDYSALTLAQAAAASAALDSSATAASSPCNRKDVAFTNKSPLPFKKFPRLFCNRRRFLKSDVGAFPVAVQAKPTNVKSPVPTKKKSIIQGDPVASKLCFEDSVSPAKTPLRTGTMHTANRILEDKTLPWNTLDLFCRDSGLAAAGIPATRMTRSDDDTASSSTDKEHVDYEDTSSLPSSVEHSKVAKVFFLLNGIQEEESPEEQSEESRQGLKDAGSEVVAVQNDEKRAKHASKNRVNKLPNHSQDALQDLKDYLKSREHFSPPKASRHQSCQTQECGSPRNVSSCGTSDSLDSTAPAVNGLMDHVLPSSKFSHARPSGRKVANRQKWLQEAFGRTNHETDASLVRTSRPITKVEGAIEKFGGRANYRSTVQRRREELERRTAANLAKNGTPTLKTKWETGSSGTSYKKKIVLSPR